MTPELVYAVAFSGDSFMMVLNTRRKGWEFPGGRVKPGEDPQAAILREFLEETGHVLNIDGRQDFPPDRAVVFYGRVGDRTGEITDPAIEKAALFSSPPEPLVFGLEECLRLLEAGSGIIAF